MKLDRNIELVLYKNYEGLTWYRKIVRKADRQINFNIVIAITDEVIEKRILDSVCTSIC